MRYQLTGMLLALGVCVGFAKAGSSDLINFNLEAVMAPSVGFDDNDFVEVVIHGTLPNRCFQLDEASKVQVDEKTFLVKQMVRRNLWRGCNETPKVPFQTTILLGTLAEGEYQVRCESPGVGSDCSQKLTVTKARTREQNENPYFLVTKIMAKDRVDATQPIEVILSGMLNTSCTRISEIKIDKVDNVFIVRPIVEEPEGAVCLQVLRPYQTKLILPAQKPGHYLIHVRSMSGRSENIVVESAVAVPQ